MVQKTGYEMDKAELGTQIAGFSADPTVWFTNWKSQGQMNSNALFGANRRAEASERQVSGKV